MRRHSESGASLILALVFTACLGFMGTVLVKLGDTSFRNNSASNELRADVYGASGAIDVYVNAMRSSASWGRENSPCDSLTLVVEETRTATVECTPVTGSGALIVGGAGARSNRIVDLVATVDGARTASARAEFIDGGGSTMGQEVRIRHWNASG
jgi:hypothetical protein